MVKIVPSLVQDIVKTETLVITWLVSVTEDVRLDGQGFYAKKVKYVSVHYTDHLIKLCDVILANL